MRVHGPASWALGRCLLRVCDLLLLVAKGSLDHAWLLPLSTPNDMWPLAPLSRAFWEMAPLCQVSLNGF